jgi:hypothetical protein
VNEVRNDRASEEGQVMERMRTLTVSGLGALALVLGACGAQTSAGDEPPRRGDAAAEAAEDAPAPTADGTGGSAAPPRASRTGDERLDELVRAGLLPPEDAERTTRASEARCRAQLSELLPC